ncbi:TRAP transporter small permease [Pararhodobacter aggregans]
MTALVNFWAMIGGLCLALIIALTAVNVGALAADMALRGWDIRVPGIYGYEDVVKLLASVAALAFFPLCQWRGGHVAVGLLIDPAPRWIGRANRVIAYALTAGIALFLAWWMAIGALEVRRDGLTTGILEWPQWPFYWPGVVSMLLWALVAAVMTLNALKGKEAAHGPA